MRSMFVILASLVPGWAGAWDLINPAQPVQEGAVTTTTVVDILLGSVRTDAQDMTATNRYGGVWIAFADRDVFEACGRISVPDPNDPLRGTMSRRFVKLQDSSEGGWLATALYVRAHNISVRVKLRYFPADDLCRVVWFETCTTPESCQPFMPPEVNP